MVFRALLLEFQTVLELSFKILIPVFFFFLSIMQTSDFTLCLIFSVSNYGCMPWDSRKIIVAFGNAALTHFLWLCHTKPLQTRWQVHGKSSSAVCICCTDRMPLPSHEKQNKTVDLRFCLCIWPQNTSSEDKTDLLKVIFRNL